jgi:hypothetical protein
MGFSLKKDLTVLSGTVYSGDNYTPIEWVIDGIDTTVWQTYLRPFPHYIKIDLGSGNEGAVKQIRQQPFTVAWYQRGIFVANRAWEFYGSHDDNVYTLILSGEFPEPVADNSPAITNEYKDAYCADNSIAYRYHKFVYTTGWGNINGFKNQSAITNVFLFG